MSLSLGNTTIKDMYLGNTKLGSAYLGNTLIYQSAHKYNYYWLEFALLATTGAGSSTGTTISNLKVNNAAPNTTQTYLWDDSNLYYANKPYIYNTGSGNILINDPVSQTDIEETYTTNGHTFAYYTPGIIRLGFTTTSIPSNIAFDINSSYGSLCDVVTTLYGSDYPYFSDSIQLEQKCHVAVKDTTASINWDVTDSGILTNAPYTLRFHFMKSTYDPTTDYWKEGSTWTQVSSSPNIWDYTHESSNWDDEFNGKLKSSNATCSVIAAGDMSGVTSMKNVAYASGKVAGGVFGSGTATNYSFVTYVCKFDTSNVTNMDGMFFRCINLKAVPNFDTSSCTSFWSTFDRCHYISKYPKFDYSNAISIRAMYAYNHSLCYLQDYSDVTSSLDSCQYAFQNNYSAMKGITNAYNYLSAANPTNYTDTFINCGRDTTTGAAELAQIPSSWGGTA